MLLERYYEDALAQASYLIGCEQTGEAIAIDPNRLTHPLLDLARRHRVRIKYVTETHIHADFLSGARDLARETKGKLFLSGHGGPDWSYRYVESEGATLVKHGDVIRVGNVELRVVHTPGHTPEHICFVVTDTSVGDRPMGMVTGDFVFVGDVGRPDLLEKAAKVTGTMETAARQLFASLQGLENLPDYLQLWPGHGAGSACGKALGAVPQTTLGYERLFNPAFQQKTERDFVRWVLADQPEPPRYFARMKQLNRDGPPENLVTGRGVMSLQHVLDAIGGGAQVIDTRRSVDFAREHIPGTINVPMSKSFLNYIGTIIDYDRPLAIIPRTDHDTPHLIGQLSLIGLDVVGVSHPTVLDEYRALGKPIAHLPTIDARALNERLASNGVRVIDVRGQSEWNEGHLPKATHIFFGDVVERTATFKREEPIIVHCASGTRSSIAASLLMARGFTDVTNFPGGFDAWVRAGLPAEGG